MGNAYEQIKTHVAKNVFENIMPETIILAVNFVCTKMDNIVSVVINVDTREENPACRKRKADEVEVSTYDLGYVYALKGFTVVVNR